MRACIETLGVMMTDEPPDFVRWAKHEGDTLTVVRHQPARDGIMRTLAELRKVERPMADLPGLGRWALSVPLEDMITLRKKFPGLNEADTMARSRAWDQVLNDPECAKYRVRQGT